MPRVIFSLFKKRSLAILFLGLPVFVGSVDSAAQEQVDFAHDILPILQSRCAECHANGAYQGGLSLESREKLLEAGVVEIGSHAESDIYSRVTSDDPDEQMPPEGKRLTADQLKKIERWIDTGLGWPVELSLRKKTFARPLELRTVELPKSPNGSTHPVDRIVGGYFLRHDVVQSDRLNDRAFIRRAKLDLLGQLPTPDEIDRFTKETDKLKHEKLIDELLSREREYADHWMSFWNDLLRNDYSGTGYIDGGRKQITQWLHRSLVQNKRYDQFVRDLINPSPESEGFSKGIKWRGRVNASQIEPLQFSQNISQVFLGINMKCASCHDSFIDDWKLTDAYGLAAITAEKPLEMHRCDVPTGETATPKFVFPSVGEIDSARSRTERLAQLAELMTSKNNGRFPRTMVNRFWHRLTGRGLVHPVDEMANEAWSEPLLDYLARDLVENNYDLKTTLRLIATSKIYRSQAISAEKPGDEFVFKGIGAKRVTAEQFVDAVWDLTGAAPGQINAAIFLPGAKLQGKWIWADKNYKNSAAGDVVNFKYEFDLVGNPTRGVAIVTCDNKFSLFLNDKKVGGGDDWTKPKQVDLLKGLRAGKNVLLIKAANGGDSPNPAALFLEAIVSGEAREPEVVIASDKSFQWVRQNVDHKNIPNNLNWQPAFEIGETDQAHQTAEDNLKRAVARLRTPGTPGRASLVISDLLMRSLGRPNREQVVTTRPADLSTLQALDLSNGETLTGWLRTGAKKWLDKKHEHQWSDQALVSGLFREALSRDASENELELLTPLDADSEVEAIEDLLWMIVMLPEFQLIN